MQQLSRWSCRLRPDVVVRKLNTLFPTISAGGLEQADVLAAFLRVARRRWGKDMPLHAVRFSRGTLTVRCPSPLWRSEVLFTVEELKDVLRDELPQISLSRISGVLA